MHRFIAIEGKDAVGKTTQTALLVDYLQKKNYKVLPIKFPRHDSFYGKLIGRYLRGELGSLESVSPYLISLVYALDRAQMAGEIRSTLAGGDFVIADRYTASNIAHHGARLSEGQQEEFGGWIEELEYEYLEIPREEVVVYLRMTQHAGEALLATKRDKDIHEQDRDYQKKVEAIYDSLSRRPHWITIECTAEDGTILAPDTIHRKIVEALKLE